MLRDKFGSTKLGEQRYLCALTPLSAFLLAKGFDPLKSLDSSAQIFHDFLPLTPSKGLLFVSDQRRTLAWNAEDMKPVAQAIASNRPVEWSPSHSTYINADKILEQFQVFGDDQHQYLVTESGSVFASTFTDGRKAEFQKSWSADTAPAVGVLVDLNSGKHHMIAVANGVGRREHLSAWYFELSRPTGRRLITLTREHADKWVSRNPRDRMAAYIQWLIQEKLVAIP